MVFIYTGGRVILLNTLSQYTMRLLEEAKNLGMMEKGWAWIVTDGTTVSSEPLYERNVTAVVDNVKYKQN